MNTGWAPKPLRPESEDPLFKFVETPTVVKGLSPIERQRLADGTPHTIGTPTALKPPDAVLTLRPDLVKGSLVEKYAERPKPPIQDPPDPMTVVKSYMAYEGKSDPDPDSEKKMREMSKSLATMQSAIQDLVKKTGA